MTIIQLNEKFGINGHINFEEGKGGFTIAKISNKQAKAIVSLYGAHVQSYQPNGQKEVLWMSPQSAFEAEKPIRGGIPVCFPWFGPHTADNQKPQHGFARLFNWEVIKTEALKNGDTELVLSLNSSQQSLSIWPFLFAAEMRIIAGSKLDVTLSYTNKNQETLAFSDGLHSYFNVSNSGKIGISGLNGHNYYAGLAKDADNIQTENILHIAQEENRRYINHIFDCIIVDTEWQRKIRVAKRGSKITVVWNPWVETTKTIADIPNDGYKSFVCIEAVNMYNNLVTLKPGESHSIATIISVE